MKKFYIFILFVLIISAVIFFKKSSHDVYIWPQNGTELHAIKYKLNLADTAKILLNKGNYLSLITPPDSLKISQLNISYSKVDQRAVEYFKTNANQEVKNSLNPGITEYYKLKSDEVFLVGYSTGNSKKPYTIFEPSLPISPNVDNNMIGKYPVYKGDTTISTGIMRTFNSDENSFNEGLKTKIEVKNLGTITIKSNSNKIQKCYFKELTLSRDDVFSYGENNLILPEAIISTTKLLINEQGYPIAEWSIKVANLPNSQDKAAQKNESKLYIEFTKFNES